MIRLGGLFDTLFLYPISPYLVFVCTVFYFFITPTFMGPIIVAEIMKKTRWLEFLLYPWKFIEIRG